MRPESTFALADRHHAVQLSVTLTRLLFLDALQTSHPAPSGRSDPKTASVLKLLASEISDSLSRSAEYARWLQKQLHDNPTAFDNAFHVFIQNHATIISEQSLQRFRHFVSARGGICAYLTECVTGMIRHVDSGSRITGGTAQSARGNDGAAACFFAGAAIAFYLMTGNYGAGFAAIAAASKAGCFDD